MQLVSDSKITSVHLPALCLLFLLAPGTWMSISTHFLVACKVGVILNAEDLSLLTNKGFCATKSEFARLLKSLIPFSWDSCVFYHLRSANLMHLKLAGTCTPACWHPPPMGARGNVWWKAGFVRTSMVNGRVLRVTFGPWTFPLQTDTSAWFILSFFHFPPGHETSFGFTSKWVFGLWFYWGPEIQSMSWLLSSVTRYSENINLSQHPHKQILLRILAAEKQGLD